MNNNVILSEPALAAGGINKSPGRLYDAAWFVLAVFIFIFACIPGVSIASVSDDRAVAIANDSLQVVFNKHTGDVQHWRLSGIDDANGELHDLTQPGGRLFSLHGTIGGVDISEWVKQAGGWSVHRRDAESLVLRLSHPDNRFSLEQIWTLSDEPWRAQFSLNINVPSNETTPDDRLWLEIGPGIGETPAEGLGIAQSLYSFTEVVYRDNDDVMRLRLQDEPSIVGNQPKIDAVDWIGLQSRYFALVMSPRGSTTQKLQWMPFIPDVTDRTSGNELFDTSLRTELPLSGSGSDKPRSYSWVVFGGGKTYDALTAVEPDLSKLLFTGLWEWMRLVTFAIMQVLNAIHALIGNWGLSIILLAVVVRLVMHPLAKKTMAAQKKFVEVQERIQPELEEIKRNYKGGEQSERILQLYEKHKVSPLAGLKPLSIVMLQIPVFVALFHLLGQVFELRSERFLWMETLAEPDRLFAFGVDLPFFGTYFNLLPVLMAVTTIASIKLSPAPAAGNKSSARQNIMLAIMAIVFFLLFYSFPSGMVLYWAVANILQVAHQRIVGAK